MADIRIEDIRRQLDNITLRSKVDQVPGDGEQFSSVLEKVINNVNGDIKASQQATMDYISGRDTNLHSTLIAGEKASISFQLMMKVRGKIMDAYHEVMRTQV